MSTALLTCATCGGLYGDGKEPVAIAGRICQCPPELRPVRFAGPHFPQMVAVEVATLQNQVRQDCDAEIATLRADFGRVEFGPEQPRVEAEKTRLLQAIHALERVRDRACPRSDLQFD